MAGTGTSRVRIVSIAGASTVIDESTIERRDREKGECLNKQPKINILQGSGTE